MSFALQLPCQRPISNKHLKSLGSITSPQAPISLFSHQLALALNAICALQRASIFRAQGRCVARELCPIGTFPACCKLGQGLGTRRAGGAVLDCGDSTGVALEVPAG